jgi:y4mF family transcriptional regulator
LGALVKRTRKAAKLRQVDLADAAGVSYRFVLDLEAGKESCQLGKALKVMAVLGIPLTAGDRHQLGSVRISPVSKPPDLP